MLTVVRDTITQHAAIAAARVHRASRTRSSFEPIIIEITGNDQLATTLSRQATDYARWALFTANHGWQVLHDVLLDALTARPGGRAGTGASGSRSAPMCARACCSRSCRCCSPSPASRRSASSDAR